MTTVPLAMVQHGAELSGLPAYLVQKTILVIWRTKGQEHYDTYVLFQCARHHGYYRQMSKKEQGIAELRCLTLLDRAAADRIMQNTIPSRNIVHGLERMNAESLIQDHQFFTYMTQYLLGCSMSSAMMYIGNGIPIFQALDVARQNGIIDDQTHTIAINAYCFLAEPREVLRGVHERRTEIDNFEALAGYFESHGLANANIARIRLWQPVPRDEIQEIFNCGRGSTEQEAREEITIQRLMKDHGIDRADAVAAFRDSDGIMERAHEICVVIARGIQEEQAKKLPILPTRDTRSPPDVTPQTHILGILGLHENDPGMDDASPSTGAGWMVSDFYLWMHILNGMGRCQEWITALPPTYLIDKYGKSDEVASQLLDENSGVWKPIRTKWANGFVHGDPWEQRSVVLDVDALPFVENMVNIGPGGAPLKDFFLERFKCTLAKASENGEPILLLMFAHGDLEQPGGLHIGTSFDDPGTLLSPEDIAHAHNQFPNVPLTLYMTSCYSGHWVQSTEFLGNNRTVLAAAEDDQESFGFVWASSQRHAGELFSATTLKELLQEPIEMPDNVDEDMSRTYKELTTAIVSDMNRLCLPENVPAFGSTPVFSDKECQKKFWKRTGYQLYDYKKNFDRLKKIPPSDPHPKRNRGGFVDGYVDDNHPDVVAWRQRHPKTINVEYPDATAGYGSTRRGIQNQGNMQYLISRYTQYQKGSSEYYENKVAMHRIRAYLGGNMNAAGQQKLRTMLISRLVLNNVACQYASVLRLYKLPHIEDWDARDGASTECRKFLRMILDSRIFRKFDDGKVPFYRRPALYLAAAMVAAGFNDKEVIIALDKLQGLDFTDEIAKSYLASEAHKRSISKLSGILKLGQSTTEYHGGGHDALS